jgi:hypothetical protein
MNHQAAAMLADFSGEKIIPDLTYLLILRITEW